MRKYETPHVRYQDRAQSVTMPLLGGILLACVMILFFFVAIGFNIQPPE